MLETVDISAAAINSIPKAAATSFDPAFDASVTRSWAPFISATYKFIAIAGKLHVYGEVRRRYISGSLTGSWPTWSTITQWWSPKR